MTVSDFGDLLERFDPVSLEELDQRAELLRRVDQKYAVRPEDVRRLLERLRDDHQVLEIEGRRAFAYCTTYFETPDLRCFSDHVNGRTPRFKVRTRLYEDTGVCMFEVKLKRSDDETDKRQIDYDAEHADRLTDDARQCLREALEDAHLDPPGELEPALRTSFDRITLGAVHSSQRLTCDVDVHLANPDGDEVQLNGGLVLVESKTEGADSPADQILSETGYEPISLSKYRVGMSLVGGARGAGPQPGSDLFD
jgi:hypothetical protein